MGMMPLGKATSIQPGKIETSRSSSQAERAASPDELKALGVSDIGEYANRISDPNFMKSEVKRGVGNNKLDKDAFMKIMLVQMKHQDPTNPLKSHEMAAQLAQFSQLEQLQNINSSIDEMRAGMRPQESLQSLNLIGKLVAGDSSRIIRTQGDRMHDISFKLLNDANQVTIKIFNEAGDEVRTVTLNNLKAGENLWTWNGRDRFDQVLPAGQYKVSIVATGSNGRKIQVKTDFEGIITGVNFTPKGTVLLIGQQSVYLKDVRKISDPSLRNKDQKTSDGAANDLNFLNKSASIKEDGAPEEVNPYSSNIFNQANISREMMEKINNELKRKE
ncbi:MAG: flagellar biosynthesis protein FlgD [Bdellovibrionaceae bacterium]|nr:flagellar biosynthesis protein FlgD [Pseudobdellovibrionaceae bacterium]MDW8189959.1 flagellar hook capping FlgD N-terminal domain-containing protein [Pseudobdellovibrionaceae bacterium]